MTTRSIAILAAACAAMMATACAARTTGHSGPRGGDLIVLLPDEPGGAIGRASVENEGGRVELAEARAATRVAAGAPPAPVTVLSQAEVRRTFADVVATLPPPPRSYTLYFRFNSEELTNDSLTLVREVLQFVKQRPFPEVVVLGHTDTTGTAARNFTLGLKRANTVRRLLVDAGLDPVAIEARSHGEQELLVPTGDEVFEPRNRRVEITVR